MWIFCILFHSIGASVVAGVYAVNAMFGTNPIGRTLALFGKFSVQESSRNIEVNQWIDEYNDLHDDSKKGVDARNKSYTSLVNAYYELATSFYEWGWGQSFHFAYQLPGIEYQDRNMSRLNSFSAAKQALNVGSFSGDYRLYCISYSYI